jgi:hypothetical protein
VPTGFTDYCRDLVLYAHSIDDIKDDDIDKIKKEDYSILETDSHDLLNSSWSFAIIVVSQYLEK